MTWVDRIIWGENGADLGSGRGPCTVHVSFNPDVERDARPRVVVSDCLDASSSRYAEPEAEGVTPVFKTCRSQRIGIVLLVRFALTHLPEYICWSGSGRPV